TAHRWLAPEQTIVTSSCGFNHLPRHVALGKLKAMGEAKRILGGTGANRSSPLGAAGVLRSRLVLSKLGGRPVEKAACAKRHLIVFGPPKSGCGWPRSRAALPP